MTKILNWLRSIFLKDIEGRIKQLEAQIKQLEDSHKVVISSLNTPQSYPGLQMCSKCSLLVARFKYQLDGSVVCANCKA